jgi:hypothetical protein
MKLSGNLVVAVVMMVGSLGAVGCKSNADNEAVAPEESAETATVVDNGTGSTNDLSVRWETDVSRVRYYAPTAPPAVRVEVQGRAPSARHFWAPGSYRWNGRQHVWVGGRWELRRDNYEYIGPRWTPVARRYEYIPGHWVRRY